MRTFDPNTNPYADDLLRLRFAPLQRYTHIERIALGRVIAAKLYDLVPDFYFSFTRRPLWRNLADDNPVELHLVFDDAVNASKLYQRLQRYDGLPLLQLIILVAGHGGVVEVFNGLRHDLSPEYLAIALDAMRGTGVRNLPEQEDAVQARDDRDAASDYAGAPRQEGRARGDVGDGRRNGGGGGADRNDRGNGGGGDGGGDDGDGPRGTSGSGGVSELVNHPVLFTVDRQVYNAILDET